MSSPGRLGPALLRGYATHSLTGAFASCSVRPTMSKGPARLDSPVPDAEELYHADKGSAPASLIGHSQGGGCAVA